MKLSEFKPAAPTPEPVSETQSPNVEEPQGTTSITPSGIEIQYEWAPRRLYRLRRNEQIKGARRIDGIDWQEVPSVTTVLGVLDKSGALTYWGMKVGAEGVLKLIADKHLVPPCSLDEAIELLVEHRLTVNHQKDKAADRGVNVHGALERWIEEGDSPWPPDWPEHERGYVAGVADFISAIDSSLVLTECESELMVGSLQHQYAGRFDLVLTLSKPVEVVTKCYPKRPPKIEEIPAGRYLCDLKTRSKANVYPTNYMQLEAYEAAAVECGYQPTDYRAVIVVTPDGKYQFSVNTDWSFEDFLVVRKTYQVLNEREALRILREELDAKEVK